MLNTPISRLPALTTRCVPGGKSATRATGCDSAIEAEEADGVLAHDLAARLVREGQAEHVAGMVEIVGRPVGGEHDRVLAVEEPDDLDDVGAPLGLLDRLRAVVEPLDVVARAL